MFGLDFDSGVDVKPVIEYCRKYSLIPNIIYSTFSNTAEKPRFRVIFILDTPIMDYNIAKRVQTGIVSLFKSDENCKDNCRMFYPGPAVIHRDDELNESSWFVSTILGSTVGESVINQKLRGRDVFGDLSEIKRPDMLLSFDWEKACEEIKILDLFLNHQVRVSYDILFGLALNLQYIKGGMKKLTNRMVEINKSGGGEYICGDVNTKRGIEKYDLDYAYRLIQTSKTLKYLPRNLDKFSPFESDHQWRNILQVAKRKRGQIDVIYQEPKISLGDAEDKFTFEFESRVVSKTHIPSFDLFDNTPPPQFNDFKITIFKIPTGMGKTRKLETVQNCLMAFPTNNLKREVYDRMQVDCLMTPDYPQFSNEVINIIITGYYEAGLYSKASDLISKITKGLEIKVGDLSFQPDKNDIMLASEYKAKNELCRLSTGTVLTTHARALSDTSFKHDTIIFDEDPLNSMIRIGQTQIDFVVFDGSDHKESISNIEDWFRNKISPMMVMKTPKFTISNRSEFNEFCAMVGRSDIINLLDSDFVYKDRFGNIHWVLKRDIPAKNIVIMSATAPVDIYKYFYPDKVEVIDLSNVQKVGKIIQYTKKSWSRHSIKSSSDKSLLELKTTIGDRPVITFMKLKGLFKNSVLDMHFGNVAGYDNLLGQDIAVIGTDHKPDFVYFFYAALLGFDNLKSSDNTLATREIERHNYKYEAYTYENKLLQDIQLSLIESESIQSCGRNRNLREPCTTLLFSSIPLRKSDQFMY